jgi:hypothetical protein
MTTIAPSPVPADNRWTLERGVPKGGFALADDVKLVVALEFAQD